jgi:hypothetical protein
VIKILISALRELETTGRLSEPTKVLLDDLVLAERYGHPWATLGPCT